jgi:hypothetical protein
MCGLVGVFNKSRHGGFNQEQRDTFVTLLLVDTLRGDDSTGAFVVKRNGDLDLAKEASTAGQFLRAKEWRELSVTAGNEGACLIGHNRKATKGTVKDENAHPFVVDDKIVLVHNGGMWGDHKKHADVEVDSHAIAHLLHENETVEKALGKFHGAYALIWYDVVKESVNIIRNKDRPLWFMETDNAWIWSSERSMLVFAAMRNNLKIVQPPTELEEFSLNTFQLKDRVWEVSHRIVKIEDEVDYEQYLPGPGKNPPFTPDAQFQSWQDQVAARDKAIMDDCERCGEADSKREIYQRPKSGLNEDFFCTVGGNTWEKTSEFERTMAKQCSKMTTLGEFNRQIVHEYNWGAKVRCRGFEYVDDGDNGFFLYASPVDDPSIIFRHHFVKQSKITEERMMQMALNEWLLELTVDKKSWSPLKKGEHDTPHQEGYTVIVSSNALLKEGGGVKEDKKEGVKNA